MEVTNTFRKGDVVPIHYDVQNWEGEYIDPSQGCLCTVTMPDGTHAQDPSEDDIIEKPMTKLETGKYVYYYYSHDDDPDDPDAWFKAECTAKDGSGDTTKKTSKTWSFRLQ